MSKGLFSGRITLLKTALLCHRTLSTAPSAARLRLVLHSREQALSVVCWRCALNATFSAARLRLVLHPRGQVPSMIAEGVITWR